jgi:hypothetical protein
MKYLRPSILLFIVAFLAYGLLIFRLGFYWDELPITWIRYQLGSEALTRYFSTNRCGYVASAHHADPPVPAYWQHSRHFGVGEWQYVRIVARL